MLPRILIIDDLFGRVHPDRPNRERANLCGQYLIQDVSEDADRRNHVNDPIAEAVFFRGQKPQSSVPGDFVENDLESTLEVVQRGWVQEPRWALVLLDLCFYTGPVTEASNRATLGMPEGKRSDDDPKRFFGLKILSALQRRFPDLPVIILSSRSRQEVSWEFTHSGALAFLPRASEEGAELLMEFIRKYGLTPDASGEIVGSSKPLLFALRAARRAALDGRNILIRGDRGTGKELIARYIHRTSISPATRPYVVVDSGTLNPQLYASELFGHRRGAFTGAERDREGRIFQANGGDLFLDEIGNMPVDVQAGLLRVLEQKEVSALGAQRSHKIDVRFLSATNQDLEETAAVGEFRQDVLDRLREGGTIFLRPLSERLDDIGALVEKFVREAEASRPGTLRRQIEPEALELLKSHHWPGNIRELRSCLFNAVQAFPDVEHLMPIHLQISSGDRIAKRAQPELANTPLGALANLTRALREFPGDQIVATELAGGWPAFRESYEVVQMKLLKAALMATKRPTPDDPEGEFLIHPAVKLLTGNKNLSASQASDLIKRFCNSPEAKAMIHNDSILRKAYETALRLRPKRPKSRSN